MPGGELVLALGFALVISGLAYGALALMIRWRRGMTEKLQQVKS